MEQNKPAEERVLSPDNLSYTLQVASPGMLFSILAILIVAIGFFVWATFGNIVDTIPVTLIFESNYVEAISKMGLTLSENEIIGVEEVFNRGQDVDATSLDRCVAFVSEDDMKRIESGMKVRTSEWSGVVLSVSHTPVRFHRSLLYPVFISHTLQQGNTVVNAEIVITEFRPISFLIT